MDFKLVDIQDTEELPLRFICVNPAALANAACLFHVDNSHKSFKIEARRFWPRDSGYKKPDPSALVRTLEEIPNKGLVRDVLFPILWQVTENDAAAHGGGGGVDDDDGDINYYNNDIDDNDNVICDDDDECQFSVLLTMVIVYLINKYFCKNNLSFVIFCLSYRVSYIFIFTLAYSIMLGPVLCCRSCP